MTSRFVAVLVCLLSICSSVVSFRLSGIRNGVSSSSLYVSGVQNSDSTSWVGDISGKKDEEDLDPKEKYTKVPIVNPFSEIRPSINDKARTITHICTSGTLCTTSVEEGVEGAPFGSYVDYVLDSNGWPVLLLSEQSLHTVNLKRSPPVSLFAQLPRSQGQAQSAAALSRVTIIGKIEPVPPDELNVVKLAFTLTHTYALQIAGKKDNNNLNIFNVLCTLNILCT